MMPLGSSESYPPPPWVDKCSTEGSVGCAFTPPKGSLRSLTQSGTGWLMLSTGGTIERIPPNKVRYLKLVKDLAASLKPGA